MLVSKRLLPMFLGLAAGVSAAVVEEPMTVATRPGVTLSCLVEREADQRPTRILVLFNSHTGKVRTTAPEGVELPFLVRTRARFAQGATAAALVDVPSDHSFGINEAFRTGEAHGFDVGRVLDDLKARYPSAVEFYFVGAGMGSVSALYAGEKLQARLRGIVLAPSFPYLLDLDPAVPGRIKVPVMLLQHRDDPCRQSAYADAQAFAARFQFQLFTLDGGPPAVSGPCDGGSAHGFYGLDAEAVGTIFKWLDGA
jgi:hypothetical protein